jgi:hypothetical protein
MNTERLVEQLIRRQGDEGWSDREMGRQLGIAHTSWRSVKLGRHGPGVLFIQHATQRFPEYLPLLFVPVDVSDSHTSVTVSTAGVAA